jgi:hypothetical protein
MTRARLRARLLGLATALVIAGGTAWAATTSAPRECGEYGSTGHGVGAQIESACPGRGAFIGVTCAVGGRTWMSGLYYARLSGNRYRIERREVRIGVVDDKSGRESSMRTDLLTTGRFVAGKFVGMGSLTGTPCASPQAYSARYLSPSHFSPAPRALARRAAPENRRDIDIRMRTGERPAHVPRRQGR